MDIFGKHDGEFRRYVNNKQFEQTDSGILFPKAGAVAKGVYTLSVNGGEEEFSENLITTEGLNYLLDVGLHAGTRIDTWYLALYANNYTPTSGLTGSNFAGTAGENTSTTEGYTETTRREWTEGVPASGSISNSGSASRFTFATATSVVIYGAALLSTNVRGGTTGKCLSATKFPASRTFFDTDTFDLTYTLSLSSV